MKILVLGGTGAMGVPVVQILAERQHEVYVTSRRKRQSNHQRVHYIEGNAQEDSLLRRLLAQQYDAIIDFMVYGSGVFEQRLPLLLQNTKHYLFLSSSRVYADNGNEQIVENMPRLLDVSKDAAYLATDEYALAKAREENLLYASAQKNWTIIRPYITYNDHRIQLGVLEKENWLQRALDGKAIVFSKDIAEKYTTLTYGYDVSLRIADLVGKQAAMGEAFHIATEQFIKWGDVLNIYLDVLEEKLGSRPKVHWLDNSEKVSKICHNRYQINYDRLYDRKFDNTKIETVTQEEQTYKDVKEGLRQCLADFLDGDRAFLNRDWRVEGAFDRLSGDKTRLSDISGWKNKIKYILTRHGINYK